jgi:DNA-binding response OmpR family regulator
MMQRRVLVFDSTPASRDLLCEVLVEHGYVCVPAWDPDSAVQGCLRNDIALALLDVDLRSVPGTDALRSVRAIRPALPIAVLTACGKTATLLEAARLGASACIHKPVSLADLVETVDGLTHPAP